MMSKHRSLCTEGHSPGYLYPLFANLQGAISDLALRINSENNCPITCHTLPFPRVDQSNQEEFES